MKLTSSLHKIREALEQYNGEKLSLLVGEPYYLPPDSLTEAMKKAADEGSNRYSVPAGNPALQELICDYERRQGLDINPDNLVIGNGSKSLLFGLFHVIADGGIMVPTPTYPPMFVQPQILNRELITIRTQNPFRLNVNHLEELSQAGSCLVIGTPSNPTGIVLTEREQKDLVAWCRKRNVRIIADEVYNELVFSDQFVSFATIDPDLSTAIVVRSFSKSLGICGWRLGYTISDPDLAQSLSRWQTVTLNPPSTIIQRALELFLLNFSGGAPDYSSYFAETAKLMKDLFTQFGISSVDPDGGFYLFINVKKVIEAGDFMNAVDLCEKIAREYGIGFWPGDDYGQPGWMRASFGMIAPENRESILDQLFERLQSFLRKYRFIS